MNKNTQLWVLQIGHFNLKFPDEEKKSMRHTFSFSDQEKKEAKAYFDAADKVLSEAIQDNALSLQTKLDESGTIEGKWISDARIIEKTRNEHGDIVEKQRPVIDLVQQGGGMWGIALLGYCYIMERVGIRFYSHGGTSAGAINALFLSAISADIYKEPPVIATTHSRGALKSEILTLIVSNMDFSSFMNRGGLVGKIQKKLFKNFNSKVLPIVLGTAALGIIMGIYFLFGRVLKYFGMGISDISYFSFVIGTFNIVAFFFLLYILLSKMLGESFGLNTGNPFLFWVKENLSKLNISSTEDLMNTLSETRLIRNVQADDFQGELKTLINSDTELSKVQLGNPSLIFSKTAEMGPLKSYVVEHPKIVLIASNLTHNRIVRFPKRASEYWSNHLQVHPAAYVRASMSLPFIFKTFIPNAKNHYKDENDPNNQVKLKARMVDGGMLSNFPIREFHRNADDAPSFPTFGVLLSKRTKIESADNLEGQQNTLIKYILSYINTFKNFYDNDFIIGNNEMKDRVVTVDTRRDPQNSKVHINWLDFWMTPEDKKLLFQRGAEAAVRQLDKFDWNAYKKLRIQLAKDAIG